MKRSIFAKAGAIALALGTVGSVSGGVALAQEAAVDAPYNHYYAENMSNIVGGGASVEAGKATVSKVGDSAEVEFLVHTQPMLTSSNHQETTGSGFIAIPKAIKDPKIEVVASSHFNFSRGPKRDSDDYDVNLVKTTVKNDTPYVPEIIDVDGMSAEEHDEIRSKMGEYSSGEGAGFSNVISYKDNDRWVEEVNIKLWWDSQKAKPALVKETLPSSDESGYTTIYPEDDEEYEEVYHQSHPFINDPKDDWYYPDRYTDGVRKFEGNNQDYDLYSYGHSTPVVFRITGTVDTVAEDTFVPVAASNLGWRCWHESASAGSFEQGCQDLSEYSSFRKGELPPALPEDQETIDLYKENNTDDGLDVMEFVNPTRNISSEFDKWGNIGKDVNPTDSTDVGLQYAHLFNLHGNWDIGYTGMAPRAQEDGADIAAFHITVDDSQDTEDNQGGDTPNPDKPGGNGTNNQGDNTDPNNTNGSEDKGSNQPGNTPPLYTPGEGFVKEENLVKHTIKDNKVVNTEVIEDDVSIVENHVEHHQEHNISDGNSQESKPAPGGTHGENNKTPSKGPEVNTGGQVNTSLWDKLKNAILRR